MQIDRFTGGLAQTNCFLVPTAQGMILFDAPDGSAEWLKDRLKDSGGKLRALILTHGHFDHTWDAAQIARDHPDAEILHHPDDLKIITNPQVQARYGFPEVAPVTATRLIDASDILHYGDTVYRIMHIPGHCPGSIVLIDDERKYAICGDVIFSGSVGRTDLPGGNFNQLIEGIRTKLFTLDDSFKLLPGHGPATTVGKERRSNPFVADLPADDEDEPELA
ncbi:MBL fold metallo-hydrolase [Kamptonema cortianum]|nr:MBL fold metallo-hydrolase [Kamptonema cortianum]MDL5050086.1 MBL fold metallo-hydrolase [Oscillatoria amoena NRMC-F 0135]